MSFGLAEMKRGHGQKCIKEGDILDCTSWNQDSPYFESFWILCRGKGGRCGAYEMIEKAEFEQSASSRFREFGRWA